MTNIKLKEFTSQIKIMTFTKLEFVNTSIEAFISVLFSIFPFFSIKFIWTRLIYFDLHLHPCTPQISSTKCSINTFIDGHNYHLNNVRSTIIYLIVIALCASSRPLKLFLFIVLVKSFIPYIIQIYANFVV